MSVQQLAINSKINVRKAMDIVCRTCCVSAIALYRYMCI